MLSLYYGIGRYISENSRCGFWGTGAVKHISEQLQKEMPGLKGFGESMLKRMRGSVPLSVSELVFDKLVDKVMLQM